MKSVLRRGAMTVVWVVVAVWSKTAVGVLVMTLATATSATVYYVDATGGSDANSGTSQAAAWQTVAKVNAGSFAAGDQILFKRGGVWRENLVVPSSGAAGNPIQLDAYGVGAAPVLTGYLDLPAASWTVDAGNVWKASVTASTMNFVLFGSIWGKKQSAKANVANDRDWYFASNILYVYATGNPATYYAGVAAMLGAGGQAIYINGKSYVNVQHFQVTYFDTYGVRVAGASDHINVANVWAESGIPNGTLPHGFYVGSTTAGAAINLYNDDAHRNYNGFSISGTSGVAVENCRAYANRMYGLSDNTANTSYSYSHFYGNGIGVLPSTDVSGGTDAGNNLAVYTSPNVVGFGKYAARVTFTVDDVGLTPGTDTYINTLTPEFEKRGLRMAMAVQTGYAAGLVAEIQSWAAAGHDPNSHSWSHQYYTNPNAFSMQYTGTGSAATLTIAGSRLTSSVSGGPGGENLNIDLTDPAYDTIQELWAYIVGHGGYAATKDANVQSAAHSYTLADVGGQDIKSAPVTVSFLKSRLMPDELGASRAWMTANVGAAWAKVYVYPDGIEDVETQGYAVAAGYEGARGGLAMGLGSSEVYASGVNAQDVTSLGVDGLHGLTAQQIQDRMAALVFKAKAWGVPYGLFGHKDTVTPAEIDAVLDGLTQHGASVMTNTQLFDFLAGTSAIAGTTYRVNGAEGREANLRAVAGSVTAGAGVNLGAGYQVDLDGRDRSVLGWDVGAATGSSVTRVSGGGSSRGTATGR
jgi:hypothetical protein